MPEQVEACVRSLIKDWKSGKKKKPTRHKSGDKWKSIKNDKDLRSAAWGICSASIQGEVSLTKTEEVSFKNPVMTGIGATNRPHIQGLEKVSVVEKDGERLLKIPILVLGRWLHRSGVLNFTSDFVEKLKAGLRSGAAGHDIAWDNRHLPQLGSLGWVKGLITETREDGKEQVSAMASGTPAGFEAVEKDRFRYGSIEFQPNFSSRMATGSALSFDGEDGGLVFLEEGEQPDVDQEGNMPDEKKETEVPVKVEVEQGDSVALEQLEKLQLEMAEMKTSLAEQQSRNVKLEKMAAEQFVAAIVAKAEGYRDSDERAHSKVFLEWLEKVLMGNPIGDTIQLEAGASTEDVHAYYRQAIAEIALELPGVVPMAKPSTEPDKARVKAEHGDEDRTEMTQEEVDEMKMDLWGISPADKKDGGE